MTSKNRSFRPSPAMIVACVALLLALTGSAIAAGVAKNSVRSAQIVDGTVRTIDLRDNAVNCGEDRAGPAVGTEEIAENAVTSPEVAPDSLTAADLGAASVTSSEVADQSLTANDLGPDSVGSSGSPPRRLERDRRGLGRLERAAGQLGAGRGPGSDRPGVEQHGDRSQRQRQCHRDLPCRDQVISGGGSAGHYGVHMTSTYRSGNGWHIDAQNNSASPTTITAYAYCLAG